MDIYVRIQGVRPTDYATKWALMPSNPHQPRVQATDVLLIVA